MSDLLPADYPELLERLKARIREGRVRAALSVNRELVLLYWEIGRAILERQMQAGWGAKVLEQLARDLRREFPEMTGLSRRNLAYMRAFAEAWPGESIVQAALAQIPWYHNIALLEKLEDPALRLWYARATVEHGWSRNILVAQIDTKLHNRLGAAPTNFSRTLPEPQSELVQQLIKDPYSLEFLSLATDALERDLERGLLAHLRDFLLELGTGFAFVGNQYHLEVGGEDFYIDLLAYHLKLHCYVVIDLKIGAFRPADAGQLNFYIAAVDDLVRDPKVDGPTIGLLLCRDKNRTVVEYALRGLTQPVGVSSYTLAEALPAELEGMLPSPEQLEAELDRLEADRPGTEAPEHPGGEP